MSLGIRIGGAFVLTGLIGVIAQLHAVEQVSGPMTRESVNDRTKLPEATRHITFKAESVPTELKPMGSALQSLQALNSSSRNGQHLIAQFERPLALSEKAMLEGGGVTLLNYLGNDAFFISVDSDVDRQKVGKLSVQCVFMRPEISWKIDPALQEGPPLWMIEARDAQSLSTDVDGPLNRHRLHSDASASGDPIVAVYVSFHPDVALAFGAELVDQHAGVVISPVHSINALVIEIPYLSVFTLANEDEVQWIEPALPALSDLNNVVRDTTEATIAQEPPYTLDGTGVTVMIYDAGTAQAHVDFGDRMHRRDSSGMDYHATHVACTVGGSGEASGGYFRGMAPGVTLESYGFQSNGNGIFLYTNPGDIQSNYDQAINVYGADIANNSIGTNTCYNNFPCQITGNYGATARLIDAIVVGSLGSPLGIVWANGNERGCSRCVSSGDHTPEGYHSTAPPACAKNHIAVGALNDGSESPASFSSWGPTDDGRIKPDIAAPGVSTTSCFGSRSYTSYSGTSMAAPAVTGVLALLIEDFRNQHPQLPDLRAASLKALLCHSARDIAETGPDYKTGFGSVKIGRAIDLRRSGNFLEGETDQGEVWSRWIPITDADTELKVTLAWDDVPGTPNAQAALVNDLDLRVFDPEGLQHFPWTLDPSHPSMPAQRNRADHLNNIEQVSVEMPVAGMWRVEVHGFNVPEGPQTYALTVTPRWSQDCNHNGLVDVCDTQCGAPGSLCDVPGCGQSADCTGNGVPDECEEDCNENFIADSCDILSGASSDCTGNGIPDECELAPDCNVNGAADYNDLCLGLDDDCTHDGIPDACQYAPDCNANGAADDNDICSGVSEDCTGNDIPDECETSPDCNGNGLADDNDICSGMSDDCTHNDIPDECEHAPDCNANGASDYNDICSQVSDDCNDNRIPDDCEPDCNENGIADECDIRSGECQDCNSNGVPDSCDIVSGAALDVMPLHGDGIPDECTTWVHVPAEYPTIQAAVDAVEPGTYILLAPGLYSGPGNRNVEVAGKPVVLIGSLARETIVDCEGLGRGFDFSHGTDGSWIHGVTIRNGSSDQSGGGIACRDASLKLSNCILQGNAAAEHGGAISMHNGRLHVESCMIIQNSAGESGGGIYLNQREYAQEPASQILSCTIAGNHASVGGGVHFYTGKHLLSGNIVWNNDAFDGPQIGLAAAVGRGVIPVEVDADHNNVEGGPEGAYWGSLIGITLHWGVGNFNSDPHFATIESLAKQNRDYHLRGDSPCINAGDPEFVRNFQAVDIDGDNRVYGRRVDVGADEFAVDCNRNGMPDAYDIASGASADCNDNAMPDECDVIEREGRHASSEDCNDNGIPDECEASPCVVCDLNGDGKVNGLDRAFLERCIEQPDGDLCAQADVDGDHKITEHDRQLHSECFGAQLSG